MIITDPDAIEARSMEIIEKELNVDIPKENKAVVKRVIHCTADFDYAVNLTFSDSACAIAIDALKGGCNIVTDTNMARSGINKSAAEKLGCELHCFMSDADVAEIAKERGCTRANASMEKAARLEKPAIFVIGNAPTALIALRDMIDAGKIKPKLVIGVPVGFVNIIEAKDAIMEAGVPYIVAKGRKGGSNVAAASKAAAIMLLGDTVLERVYLMTPHGIGLTLTVHETVHGENSVSCGIVKDSGDDPDITNGLIIYARVEKTDTPGEIFIDGGEGIGRVTKPGLDQPIGNAAINSTPRRMIAEEFRHVCEDHGYTGGLRVIIFAPAGVEIAKKTFNPRLGIVGGLSILGTTGIVEPMSDEAVVETIRTKLFMRAADGKTAVLFTPGNYGADYIKNELHIDPEIAVITSNFIGDAFALAAEFGFRGALLVGHIGKLIKVAGGMFNTHSRYGDCRMEIFASHAGMCGASAEAVRRIMDSAMTDGMLSILDEVGLRQNVMDSVTERIHFHLTHRPVGSMTVGAVTFSSVHGILGKTADADILLTQIRKEY